MSRPDFDINHPHGHVTRDGRKARIYATDAGGIYSIHGAIEHCPGLWLLEGWKEQGWNSHPGTPHPQDLINASEPPTANEMAYRELIEWALDTLQEINPSNYDHDDACALNAASVEVILALQAALKTPPPSIRQESAK